jgi:hypothetical protein
MFSCVLAYLHCSYSGYDVLLLLFREITSYSILSPSLSKSFCLRVSALVKTLLRRGVPSNRVPRSLGSPAPINKDKDLLKPFKNKYALINYSTKDKARRFFPIREAKAQGLTQLLVKMNF